MIADAVERYLATLPAGLDSFADAHAKATVVLPWCQGAVGASLLAAADLPAPLRAFVEQPPTVSAWIPEVTLAALIVAAEEAHFAQLGGAEALQAFIRTTNRAALSGPLYRVLFAVASPERLLAGVAQRWSAFHRGSTLVEAARGDGRATLELTHPPHIFPEAQLCGHGTTFALAAQLAGARGAQMSYAAVHPRLTRYEITWG